MDGGDLSLKDPDIDMVIVMAKVPIDLKNKLYDELTARKKKRLKVTQSKLIVEALEQYFFSLGTAGAPLDGHVT